MYDKKYLEGAEYKTIETIGEAIGLIAAKRFCGSCSVCPVRMYEEEKGSGCGDIVRTARKFLEERGITVRNADEMAIEAYNACTGVNTEPVAEPAEEEEEQCECNCSTCYYSEPHSSGILFCNSFHNFTHAEGNCYRFKRLVWEEEA